MKQAYNAMPSSRRNMLKRLLAGAAGGALLTPFVGDLLARKDPLELSSFVGREGSSFVVRNGRGEKVSLVLQQAVGGYEKAVASGAPDCEWFAVEFIGPRNWHPEQDIYTFDDAELGRFQTMLTPIYSRDGRPHVEFIVNRIVA